MNKFASSVCYVLCAVVLMTGNALAATKKSSKGQSAIQNGTSVRTKVEANGLYDQACYDAYYGCMDQFCITENTSGGSCACHDDITKYETQLAEIQATLLEAERIRNEEVEKVKAGANADIIFAGKREYDENGNVKKLDALDNKSVDKKEQRRRDLAAIFESASFDDDDEDEMDLISDQTGAKLFASAEKVCLEQIPDSCDKDSKFLRQLYSRQIVSDCKGLENSLNTKRAQADQELIAANNAVRDAMKESFDAANKYNQGECMVEFKKCMQTSDACGSDWGNCVATIASENMQNNKAVSTAGTKVATVDVYGFTPSTLEMLESKRIICERVLDQCVAVRDLVWPAFLRESAPTIKLAEQRAESNVRQSCLGNISECIQNACKDDIVGKGVDTMDACLARPDMARSFCKVEIDPCERMEPQIWSYVVDKLAAMRVDVCTQEVKDCFTDENRCGANFQNCLGMDYDYIHDICPIDKLVVCKKANPNFSMDDLDSMLMGLYLNIDNSAMEQCQNIVDAKMTEICGSTTDCNRFAADDTIGTGSLKPQKDGSIYRVTGMISFGSIKMGTASVKTTDGAESLEPGEIGISDYLDEVRNRFSSVDNADAIISNIEAELNNIAGTINRTIEMIEQDPEIQFCVNGRDLSQITGNRGDKTTGRFPHLLNQVKMQIAISALRQAQDNYNAKFNAAVADATKDASADIAQYMCQKIAQTGATAIGQDTSADVVLTAPYAISYDISAGLNNADLTKNGSANKTYGFKNKNGSGGNVSTDVTATFNRESRTCHICRTISSQSCSTKGGNWFRKANTDCKTTTSEPKCEDVKM
ncbi:MAG: hypothetical protein IJ560_04200 [Alphaproteobacteria bacterium]|nr:hypothetical protein [Alphaproteobacteria bacterium]